MQAPNWTDFLQCSVCTNRYDTTTLLPISLSCGHTICKKCLTKFMARVCPYDKTTISPNAELLPPNSALLWLLRGEDEGGGEDEEEVEHCPQLSLPPEDLEHFKSARSSIKSTAFFLQPLAEPGGSSTINYLTRPMLKKLVTVVNCQFLEPDGRARVLRAARSITDRTVTELLVMHQNQQQISTLLWSAIRSRGCQFLGPVMQEEALKLILKVLEGGSFLSRKNIVLYVVQQLQQQEFTQASKTCVGHVVQLLYRASCFSVEKRDEDSSRMRLKEEFRTYEALRREHDAQIIRVAMESGLRISPEQWSALLYGDQKHKSDMQSIIDKLLSQGVATSGLSELIVAIRRSQDQHNLLEKIVPHLETLLKVDINIDKSSDHVQQWKFFSDSMAALVAMLHEYSSFMQLQMRDSHTGPNPSQIQSGRYKTGLCPNLMKPGGCPKGEKCTYAHTEEEREKYRHLARGAKTKSREMGKPVSGPQPIPLRAGNGGRWSGDIAMAKLDSSPYSSLGAYDGVGPGYSGGSSGFGVPDRYSNYSGLSSVGNTASIVLQPSLSVVGQPQNLTSDPTLANHVIPGQPQLVTHHHSGPLTVSGEQLAVYDPSTQHMESAFFPAPRRSNSIPSEYEIYSGAAVVGVASGGQSYSAQSAALPPESYMPVPSTSLDSIKQVHADIKRSIQPSYVANAGGHSQYLAARGQPQYPPNEREQYEAYSQPGVVPAVQSSEEWHYHHVNNSGSIASLTGPGEYLHSSSSGEEVGRAEAGLTDQLSRINLKEPAYYEASTLPAPSAGGSVAHATAGYESHSQYSVSHSSKYPTTTEQPGHGMGTAPQQSLSHSPEEEKGEGQVEAMKEKIRLLETQLAEEKMRTTQMAPQTMQQSPGHTGLVYGNMEPQGYHVPAQQFSSRVQQVQMYPAVSVQQPAFYPTSQPTPSPSPYQYNWSGPQQNVHYSGELARIQSVQPGTGTLLLQQQQQAGGRGMYVSQQQGQDVLNKDHMLAVYLQALEQNRAQHQQQPSYLPSASLPSPYPPSQPQTGYGGRVSLGYHAANQYVAPSATQYVMKPY